MKVYILGISLFVFVLLGTNGFAQIDTRVRISLNGEWEIAEGLMKTPPDLDSFYRKVPVPGLVTLSTPSFLNVAPKVLDRDNNKIVPSDPLREAFWYKRTFEINKPIPGVANLKISKAKYGTKVYINGKEAGSHLHNFTPGYFDIRNLLKKGKNEIMVRVGASRAAVPRNIADGFDYEKERYIPGIYDDVQLILSSGRNFIQNVQVAPDIYKNEILTRVWLKGSLEDSVNLLFKISEAKTGIDVSTFETGVRIKSEDSNIVTLRIPLRGPHLWTPEDPFLYKLTIQTDDDDDFVSFGMREFHFDQGTNTPMLNGKPYYLRGSNITLYRFFEDPACGDLPWDTTWVQNLFKSFKQFHWNTLRYCIGLPPGEWYRIADEEGFLIQDEFPVWYGGVGWNTWPKELRASDLAIEYKEWLEENWNHPSIVIWDASNENLSNSGITDETGNAAWQVRSLDLSKRSWDNSYNWRRAPGDVFEAHPYHFYYPDFKLRDIQKANITPFDVNLIRMSPIYHNTESFPVIINEYGWLWLNRDGTPTTLTQKVYENLLGPNSTTEERWHLYATYMAAETEFWRAHRKAAGVLIFTALGYSRPDGQTSDFFTDVKNQTYQEEILKYLPDAFNPIGIMLDEWGTEIEVGKSHDFNVITVNDLDADWKGKVELSIRKDGKVLKQKTMNLTIPAYEQKKITIPIITPDSLGEYELRAALIKNGKRTESIREKVPFK